MAFEKVFCLTQRLQDVPLSEDWLSVPERARAAGMRFLKRRRDWTLGRWTAKNAVREFFCLQNQAVPGFEEMEIRSAADGAPEIFLGGAAAPFSISLSHSYDVGFCVIGQATPAVGCDLETIQLRTADFIEDYLLGEERSQVYRAPADKRPCVATLIWCAKESVLKCVRQGLRRDTRSVSVELGNEWGDGWNPLSVRCLETSLLFHGWWRRAGDYVQTIAAAAPIEPPVELQRKSAAA